MQLLHLSFSANILSNPYRWGVKKYAKTLYLFHFKMRLFQYFNSCVIKLDMLCYPEDGLDAKTWRNNYFIYKMSSKLTAYQEISPYVELNLLRTAQLHSAENFLAHFGAFLGWFGDIHLWFVAINFRVKQVEILMETGLVIKGAFRWNKAYHFRDPGSVDINTAKRSEHIAEEAISGKYHLIFQIILVIFKIVRWKEYNWVFKQFQIH